MTITPITPAPSSRTAAATAAKMRKSEQRWADHLRGRDWAVIDPDHVAALERLVANYCEWVPVPMTPAEVWELLGMPGHVPSC